MAQIGINEEMVYLYNPNPEHSMGDLYEYSEVMKPSEDVDTTPAFVVEFQYSTGSEKEMVKLEPGKAFPIQKSLASAIHKRTRHRGIIISETKEPSKPQCVRGLREALAFWKSCGTDSLRKVRARQGYSDEDLDSLKHGALAPYYLNIAREAATQQAINETPEKAKTTTSKTAATKEE